MDFGMLTPLVSYRLSKSAGDDEDSNGDVAVTEDKTDDTLVTDAGAEDVGEGVAGVEPVADEEEGN